MGLFALALLVLTIETLRRAQSWWLRIFAALLTLAFFAVSTPLGANLMLGALERRARLEERHCGAPPPGSLIIVLAGGIRGDPDRPHDFSALSAPSLYRLFSAVRLADQTPRSILLISGGWGKTIHEANLMGTLAEQLGFPWQRVELDTRSRTTFESALNVASAVEKYPQRQRYLVTSADHMPRALMAFHHAGLSVCARPVDFEALPLKPAEMLTPQLSALSKSTRVMHEALGMLYYDVVKFQ